MRKALSVPVGLLLLILCAAAPPAGAVEVPLRIERVALFKNGLAYLVSGGVLPAKAVAVDFGRLPVPSLGTFWAGYSKNVAVKGLFGSVDEAVETVPAQNVAQVLASNIGRTAVIGTGDQTVRGEILAVTQAQPSEPPSPYLMNVRRADSSRGYGMPAGPQVVVIKTETGTSLLNAGSISRVDIAGADVKTAVPVPVRKPRVRMELEKPAPGEKVSVTCLARGITWSPSYLIDLSDPATARLSAAATVINEAADLVEAQVDLVTGFPNIQFADVNNPIAMTQSLADFLNALQRGRSEQRESAMTQQRAIMSNVARWDGDASAPMPSYSTAAAGAVAEDLFFYPAGTISLKKGETCCLPLFTASVPYRHIYVWSVPDFLDQTERYRGGRERGGPEPAEEVWHSCRLTNTMKMPWTTAPAEFVTGGAFTGQDICYYTAPGAETTVRINRAMNVLAEQAEYEVERKRDAATFYGYRYDKVTVKGELKLRSRLDKAAAVEVTKELSGEVRETLPAAKDTATARGLKKVNPAHRLVWTIDLKPGAEQTLAYTYEVYVRE